MVAPAIPLIYWGIAILAAGGTTVALQQYRDEDLELGRIEMPDILKGGPEPEPEPERRLPDGLTRNAAREALRQMVESQTRLKRRCQDQDEQECPYCKPAVDGNATSPWHSFEAGTVRKPSPRARGSLYQHYVLPWHGFSSEERDGKLVVSIEEWEWKRGRAGSWDGLDYAKCQLYECKLGYRDYIDEARVGQTDAYSHVNSRKPFLGTLLDQWRGQIMAQHAAFTPDWPIVSLEWVFSDNEVLWQFVAICSALGITNIGAKHRPYHLAPEGTNYVRELYESGEQDYGYWEDN